jgi:Rha family phage regulatory protein
MENLVKVNLENGRMTTTSLKVADIFGKDHDKVCRDIKNLQISKEFNVANFGVIEYVDARGRNQKAFKATTTHQLISYNNN